MKYFVAVLGMFAFLALSACNQVDTPNLDDPKEEFVNFVPIAETKIDFLENAIKLI
jgi:hypothetical protein